jgi:hypothetical protein
MVKSKPQNGETIEMPSNHRFYQMSIANSVVFIPNSALFKQASFLPKKA